MQHQPEMEVMRRALRAEICPRCTDRPAGSEKDPPDQPRSCEPNCTIFHHLPTIQTIAAKVHADVLRPYERAVKELICQHCDSTPTPGDYCDRRTTRSCPLSRYLGQVVDVLERVNARRRAEAQK